MTKWRKRVALFMSIVMAGAWLPFTGATPDEPREHDDDDDEFTVPPPLFEGHEFPSWPEVHVPGNTQHTEPPKPPKPKKAVPRPVEHTVKHVKPTPVADKPISVLLSFLRAQLGKPYTWGGNGPRSYDCSGLTKAAYAKLGVYLPRTAEEQSLRGTRVSLSHLEAGDLLFWGSPGSAHHVAIYVGHGQFIGAQNPSTGVVQRSLSFDPPSFARRVL